MSEGQQPEAPASPETPATPAAPAFDPEAFLARIDEKMNERVSGLQSVFDRKLNEYGSMIEELKTATLSEEEREQLSEQKASEYVEELERKVALAELGQKYSKAAPHIQKLFETQGDVAAFAEYLESTLNPAPATPDPEPEVPDVDPNRPAPSPAHAGPLMPDGTVLTKELADSVLASFGDTPIATLRGQ